MSKKLKDFIIWLEGYEDDGMGESEEDECIGFFQAETFEEACLEWVQEQLADRAKYYNVDVNSKEITDCYDVQSNMYWGQRLLEGDSEGIYRDNI
jgi:hypothetical protein